MEEAAALIEVKGVLNSWARACSRVDFIASFCRAASVRAATDSARALSMAMAARLAIACNAVSEIDPPQTARLPKGFLSRLRGKTDRFASRLLKAAPCSAESLSLISETGTSLAPLL